MSSVDTPDLALLLVGGIAREETFSPSQPVRIYLPPGGALGCPHCLPQILGNANQITLDTWTARPVPQLL
ncbi:hypothetical protein EVAR_36604_1 [Eumeta japonica]|uniref:Uncharacterized protein n=1 Tax=Eumeta variegata TaxID=151549 RepID=A0A4C1ZM84_EUMVA|nr:hypothetical protein EVAR_36604_1 [Eumeta japonica]